MHYSISAVTDVGMVRQTNEDMFLIAGDEIILGEGEHFEARIEGEGDFLVVLADGGGGRPEKGIFAAHLAVESILTFLKKSHPDKPLSEVVLESLQFANREMLNHKAPSQLSGAMAEVALIVKRGKEYCFAKYGDVFLFLIRGTEVLVPLREFKFPDTILSWGPPPDVEPNSLKKESLELHLLGIQEEINPSIALFNFRPGDYFLLLSKGVYGKLKDGEVQTQLPRMTSVEGPASLVYWGNMRGGEFNLTSVGIGFGDSDSGDFSNIPISTDLNVVRFQFSKDSQEGVKWTNIVKGLLKRREFARAKKIADSVPDDAHREYLLSLLVEAEPPR